MAAQDTGAQRVANCHAGHQERGLKLVRVWVPEQDVDRIREHGIISRSARATVAAHYGAGDGHLSLSV